MSALEATYRKALRWYPKKWRAANEDAVVGTLLDQAEDAHREMPARGELADLRKNALARRLGPLGRISPGVRDRVGSLAFGLGGAIGAVALIVLPTQSGEGTPAFRAMFLHVGPYIGYSFLVDVIWVLALICGFAGWKWIARGLAAAAIPVAIAIHVVPTHLISWPITTTTIVLSAVLTAMSFLGNPFATRRGRVWIGVSALAWAAFLGFTLVVQTVSRNGFGPSTDWYIGPVWLWLEWVIPPALIVALVLWAVRRSPWGQAIMLILVPLTAFAIFGWWIQFDELLDKATLMGLAIGLISLAFFIIELARGRIRFTRV